MVQPIYVDGSYGEGGGQILRLSISLSALTGRPVRVGRIRATRKNPGIRPQHLAAVRALAQMCDAKVEGDRLGSSEVIFYPTGLKGGRFSIDCGTAGSVTLILQAIIGPAAFGPTESDFALTGGTDVPWSPTCDYVKYVLLPTYRMIGIDATMHVDIRGYYPKGGGSVSLKVRPAKELNPLDLKLGHRGEAKIRSVASGLPLSVAQRQAESCRMHLFDAGIRVADTQVEVQDAASPGTALVVYHDSDGTIFGCDGIGERGKPAERVGREVAERFVREYRSLAPVDSHLSDMLPHILSFAPRPSSYNVSEVTDHLRSCLYVTQLLTGKSCSITASERMPLVRIGGATAIPNESTGQRP